MTTAFTHERWGKQHLSMRDGTVAVLLFHVVRGEAGTDTGHQFLLPILHHHWSTAYHNEMWSPHHLFTRNGVHNIYSREMKSIVFTHERRRTHGHGTHGVDSISHD